MCFSVTSEIPWAVNGRQRLKFLIIQVNFVWHPFKNTLLYYKTSRRFVDPKVKNPLKITIYIYHHLPPDPPVGGIAPPDPAKGVPPSALPHVEKCTYFWGVNTSWGINTVESKDL